MTLRNRSQRPLKLDAAGAALYLTDGTQSYPPNPADVIAAAPADRQEQLRDFKPPFEIAPGSDLSQGVLFFPSDRQLAPLDHVRLTLNGAWVNVTGRPLSDWKKRDLIAPRGAAQ